MMNLPDGAEVAPVLPAHLATALAPTLNKPRGHDNGDAENTEHRAGRGRNMPDDTDAGNGRPSAVVIGAGLGGLSAAIHLARQGWKVDVIERNARSGGRMNVIREKGFTIDMGPTMLMMPEVIENTFSACGRDIKDYLSLDAPDSRLYDCLAGRHDAQHGRLHCGNDRARAAVRARRRRAHRARSSPK